MFRIKSYYILIKVVHCRWQRIDQDQFEENQPSKIDWQLKNDDDKDEQQ